MNSVPKRLLPRAVDVLMARQPPRPWVAAVFALVGVNLTLSLFGRRGPGFAVAAALAWGTLMSCHLIRPETVQRQTFAHPVPFAVAGPVLVGGLALTAAAATTWTTTACWATGALTALVVAPAAVLAARRDLRGRRTAARAAVAADAAGTTS